MDIDPPYSLRKQLEMLIENWEEQEVSKDVILTTLVRVYFKYYEDNFEEKVDE